MWGFALEEKISSGIVGLLSKITKVSSESIIFWQTQFYTKFCLFRIQNS